MKWYCDGYVGLVLEIRPKINSRNVRFKVSSCSDLHLLHRTETHRQHVTHRTRHFWYSSLNILHNDIMTSLYMQKNMLSYILHWYGTNGIFTGRFPISLKYYYWNNPYSHLNERFENNSKLLRTIMLS